MGDISIDLWGRWMVRNLWRRMHPPNPPRICTPAFKKSVSGTIKIKYVSTPLHSIGFTVKFAFTQREDISTPGVLYYRVNGNLTAALAVGIVPRMTSSYSF